MFNPTDPIVIQYVWPAIIAVVSVLLVTWIRAILAKRTTDANAIKTEVEAGILLRDNLSAHNVNLSIQVETLASHVNTWRNKYMEIANSMVILENSVTRAKTTLEILTKQYDEFLCELQTLQETVAGIQVCNKDLVAKVLKARKDLDAITEGIDKHQVILSTTPALEVKKS